MRPTTGPAGRDQDRHRREAEAASAQAISGSAGYAPAFRPVNQFSRDPADSNILPRLEELRTQNGAGWKTIVPTEFFSVLHGVRLRGTCDHDQRIRQHPILQVQALRRNDGGVTTALSGPP